MGGRRADSRQLLPAVARQAAVAVGAVSVMNVVGGLGFVINCSWNGAWPSVALNAAWMAIAVYALRRNSRSKA